MYHPVFCVIDICTCTHALSQCSVRYVNVDCDYNHKYAATEEGRIRLVGGTIDNEGRVEVYHNGAWGTVCDDSWDINDANVVCRQLGYSRATSANEKAAFGEGSGPIYYDEVACTGTEARLTDCDHRGIGNHDCAHYEDAGVVCDTQGQLNSD